VAERPQAYHAYALAQLEGFRGKKLNAGSGAVLVFLSPYHGEHDELTEYCRRRDPHSERYPGSSGSECGAPYLAPSQPIEIPHWRSHLANSAAVKAECVPGCVSWSRPKRARSKRRSTLARQSDVAILFLGTNLKVETEGRDRQRRDLPGSQEWLLGIS
jgi:hypothetical protein